MLVELALGSAVILTAFGGAFEFGFTFYRYNSLAVAVNNGARLASVISYDSATEEPSLAYTSAVKNLVVYGDPAGGSAPAVPGLAPSHVAVRVAFANGVPGTVTVSVSGYTIDSLFGRMNCQGKPSVSYAFTGIYAPY